jgi:thiazolylpeptide-type bacteriocin precursor
LPSRGRQPLVVFAAILRDDLRNQGRELRQGLSAGSGGADCELHKIIAQLTGCVITPKGFTMGTTNFADTFASFDIAELEVLEVSAGTALPEMGASNGSIVGCSSSSSSSCC